MGSDQYATVSTDVLVIGAGAAGMRAAIAAAERGRETMILTKGQAGRSGATPMACPSYQAAFAMEDNRDSSDIAFEDTCFEGRYLGDEDLIAALTEEATERAMDLREYGVKFRKKADGKYLQVVHPGHSYARNLVIMGSGFAMASGLRRRLSQLDKIRVLEDAVATQILLQGDRVAGVVALDMRQGQELVVQAKAVVLATGGYAELWKWTDTEPGLTGDGVWLAYEAAADLVDLEMMLFYPTGLCHPAEVEGTLVQYEGLMTDKYCAGVMVNGRGEEFLPKTDRLPVRDVMMKLMFREVEAGRGTPHGGVYIDLTQSPRTGEEIIGILAELDSLPYNNLADLGVHVLTEPIEVRPVTHYTLGGVRINPWGETTVKGLFAAGEVSGNIHGANRTSGNALAETMVFGARAGTRAAEYAAQVGLARLNGSEIAAQIARIEAPLVARPDGVRPIEVKRELKGLMDREVNYRRDRDGLSRAITELRRLREEMLPRLQVAPGHRVFNYEWQEALEVPMMIDLAELVAASALAREESRGHHWRSDFPRMRLEWEKHVIARRDGDSSYRVSEAPVVRLKDRSQERRAADDALLEAGVLDNYERG